MPPFSCRSIGYGIAAASIWLAAAGSAQAQSAADKSAAEALFAEARKLLDAGRYAEACERLADSQRLDPGVGTLLNLARCYEKIGQTASAFNTYREAASTAHATGQNEREKAARRAAAALDSKLPKLVIAVSEAAAAASVEVKRDGSKVPKTLWGLEVAVDPGEHLIEASAAGSKPWSTRIKAEAGKPSGVTVPKLEPAPVAPVHLVEAAPQPVEPSKPSQASPDTGSSTPEDTTSSGLQGQRVGAIVAGGLGIVAIGVGTGFALAARSTFKHSNSSDPALCNEQSNLCRDQGLDERSQALQQANIATGAFIGGAVALAAGAILWFTTPSPSSSAGQAGWKGVGFAADPARGGTAGISFSGTW